MSVPVQPCSAPFMRKLSLLALALAVIAAAVLFVVSRDLQTRRNDVSISIADTDAPVVTLSIAVLGDIHVPENPDALASTRQLLAEVKASEPDLVLFVGDYIVDPSRMNDFPTHRENVINAFKLVDPVPRAIVLGNYEGWSDPDSWLAAFERLGVDAMENQTRILETKKGPVCVRGFGDAFSERFRYVDFPVSCRGVPKLSITHDPAGAFEARVKGLVIAGHTHCGQVSFPFVGPLWVPSEAPPAAYCGLYRDRERTLFVTSGVGTSILPLRFGAPSQWDFITLKINRPE